MKKILSFFIVFVMLIASLTFVNATSSDELADKLYDLGRPYGMTSADKLKIERYLADNEVSDDEANRIVGIAEEAVKVMESAGVTSYTQLTDSQKDKIKSLAKEAADVLDLTLVFSNKKVEIYKNGKLIEVITSNNGKLAYTGNSTNTILVVSSVAVIALTLGFAARKKFANA